jgi:hypothetical protein
VTQADGERWQSLYWEWPLATERGLRFERVTLFVGGLPPAATPAGAPAGSSSRGALGRLTTTADPAAAELLIRAAQDLIGQSVSVDRGAP